MPYSPLYPARRNGSGKRGGSRPTVSKRSICSEGDPELRLNLNFTPVDIQFVPNHAILHAAWRQADTWSPVTEQLSQAHPAALLLLLDLVC
jgi:hypothetical protein